MRPRSCTGGRMRLSETTLSLLADLGDGAAFLALGWLRLNGSQGGAVAACTGRIRAGNPDAQDNPDLWKYLWPESHPLGKWGQL